MFSKSVVDWRLVDQTLRSLARRRATLDAEEARWLREAERLRIWDELGQVSMLSYMEEVFGYGPRAAAERLRVARTLERLPMLEEALSAGSLSYSAARELTRVAEPETQDAWLHAATRKNLREIEELVAQHAPGDLPDGPACSEPQTRRVHYEVSAETFALVRQTRAALEDECGHALDDDAFLMAVVRRALEGASPEPARALHQIAITVCDHCGRGWQDGAGVVTELDESTVEQAFCDADIGSTCGAEPVRAVQDVPPAVRRMVMRRDHGRCRVLGCRSARNLDLHHIVLRTEGGSNDPANLILCCSAHHRAAHRGLLSIRGTADALVITRSAAEPIAIAPEPTRDSNVDVAIRALARMGFAMKEARTCVADATAHVGNASLKELVHEALRRSPSPALRS